MTNYMPRFRHRCNPCMVCGSTGLVLDCPPECDHGDSCTGKETECPACEGKSTQCTCEDDYDREAERRVARERDER